MLISIKLIILRLQRRWLGWLMWTSIWVAVSTLFASLFDSLSIDAAKMDELFVSMPPAMMQSFNISTGYLSKVESFISGQFLTIYTLIGAIFALNIGIGELGGKIADRTIVQWITKPITRAQLYIIQWLTNVVFLVFSNIVIWAGMYILFDLLTKQSVISTEYFVYGALGCSALFITSSSLGQFVGVLLNKNAAQGLGVGILVLSWFLDSLSSINGYPTWLKPLSLYYYFDKATLRDQFTLEWPRFWVLVVVTLISLIAGILIFRRKDLHL